MKLSGPSAGKFTFFEINIYIIYMIVVNLEGSRGQGFKVSSEMYKSYRELSVWPKLYEHFLKIFKVTAKFLNKKKSGLTSQVRRSPVSIPYNIAKGYGRKKSDDYIRMLNIFYGFVSELEAHILLAGDSGFIKKGELGSAKKEIAEIERMLKALIESLENKKLNH